jgi:hypothetical protein
MSIFDDQGIYLYCCDFRRKTIFQLYFLKSAFLGSCAKKPSGKYSSPLLIMVSFLSPTLVL